ncbi:ornithine carbamoyltransferase [Streptoalloteichus hindustanus]|uniref:Ornithine carbamoyltransferase n=1 Tax=Streptoalloteichus hindustanus TaxID=2017 RepID=A0A1M5P525_STRHI|nr:ornithine carbamoyltransferase [Streptoalloteichus hindustanus]SHG96313.1 ornithine carbamoyltransferase [Streptoalloteichus hindustanus]
MTTPTPANAAARPVVPGPVPRNLLRVGDLAPDTLAGLLDLAAAMKREPLGWTSALPGAELGCLFEKPSTRTRVSLVAAAHRLGMRAIVLNREETQLDRGETAVDTARVLSCYLDVLAVRTFAHAVVEEMAGAATVPVVNALTNTHHPCQALADLLTLREHFGELAGMTVAFVGDGRGNTCHSFLGACAATGMNLTIASPREYDTDQALLAEARELMAHTGGSVSLTTEPAQAVRGAHAVYTDAWVPMDKHHEQTERVARFAGFRVDDDLLAQARQDTVVLHCLPAVRGLEITSEVLDGNRSLVWRQAANRLPTAQAVLHTLVTTAGERAGDQEPHPGL